MTASIIKNYLIDLLSKRIRKRPDVLPVPGSISDHAAHLVGTFGFTGYLPVIPATFGSAAAVVAIICGQYLAENFSFINVEIAFPLAIAAAFFGGVWASNRIAQMTGSNDPSIVVIDEVAGQLVTFVFIFGVIGWLELLAGFLLFRFFDVFKFYPADKFERLPHGFGIMLDDIVSGFYAAVALGLTLYLFF